MVRDFYLERRGSQKGRLPLEMKMGGGLAMQIKIFNSNRNHGLSRLF